VGAWVQEKGLHILLEAILRLPTAIQKKITLTIASNETLWYSDFPQLNTTYVQRIKQTLKHIHGVRLLGGVPAKNMPQIYRSHDTLMMPSLWEEPCPLSLLEALACGTPTIAFNTGGIKELIDKTYSTLVSQKTPKALTSAIYTAYKHSARFQNHDISLPSPLNIMGIYQTRAAAYDAYIKKVLRTKYL
jgi:spore coat protein SA